MKKFNMISKLMASVFVVCVYACAFPAAGQNSVYFASKVLDIDSLRVAAAIRPVDKILDCPSAGWREKQNIVKRSAAALARIFPLSSSNTVRLVYNIKSSGQYDTERASGITAEYVNHVFNDGHAAVRINNRMYRKTGDINLKYKYMLYNRAYVSFYARLTVTVELFQDMIMVKANMTDIITRDDDNKSRNGVLNWVHDMDEMEDVMREKSGIRVEHLIAYIKACDAMMKFVTRYINVLNIEMNQSALSYNK